MTNSWLAPPIPELQALQRSSEEQRNVNAHTANMALYHYETCMFCAGVRKAMGLLSLNIELRDIHENDEHFRALLNGGGRGTVPCLFIDQGDGDATWMYESGDIVRYLSENFGSNKANPTS